MQPSSHFLHVYGWFTDRQIDACLWTIHLFVCLQSHYPKAKAITDAKVKRHVHIFVWKEFSTCLIKVGSLMGL